MTNESSKEIGAPPEGTGNLPAITPKKELVLEGDPEKQLEFAHKAAKTLMKVVKPRKIGGKDYLEFGGWQTLARFFGATVGVEWTKPIESKGSVVGYEARAEVLQHGVRISSAEASCLRSERNWTTREEFAIKSMAQTRASAKALRNAFGWVAELAGYAGTPAEEMDYDQSPVSDKAVPTVTYDDPETPGPNWKRAKKLGSVSAKKAKEREIVALIDSIVLTPIIGTKEEKAEKYRTYVYENTGLIMVPENYDAVIRKLTGIKHGEEIEK